MRGSMQERTIAWYSPWTTGVTPGGAPSSLLAISERNFVVEIAVGGAAAPAAARTGAAVARRIPAAATHVAIVVVAAAFHRAAAAARAVEHRQFAAEALQHDLGRIALLAVLVGPFAGLQR